MRDRPDRKTAPEGSYCSAQSMVRTEAGYREIRYLHQGDVVLTHTGLWKRVQEVRIFCPKQAVRLTAFVSLETVVATPDLSVFVSTKINGSDRSRPHWKRLRELTPFDFVAVLTPAEPYFYYTWKPVVEVEKVEPKGKYYNVIVDGENSLTIEDIAIHGFVSGGDEICTD